MKKQAMYRQGDVLIIPVAKAPKLGKKFQGLFGRLILAEGEVTGHAHAILDTEAELHEIEHEVSDRLLRVLVEDGAKLVHEEHGQIKLPKGDYIVRLQREYDPISDWHRVSD
jgi:hypothetical protein